VIARLLLHSSYLNNTRWHQFYTSDRDYRATDTGRIDINSRNENKSSAVKRRDTSVYHIIHIHCCISEHLPFWTRISGPMPTQHFTPASPCTATSAGAPSPITSIFLATHRRNSWPTGACPSAMFAGRQHDPSFSVLPGTVARFATRIRFRHTNSQWFCVMCYWAVASWFLLLETVQKLRFMCFLYRHDIHVGHGSVIFAVPPTTNNSVLHVYQYPTAQHMPYAFWLTV